MAELTKPSEILKCKAHPDCKTQARVVSWSCGCVEVHLLGHQGYGVRCEDFAGMACRLEHEHDQEPTILMLREKLRKQHERVLALNPNWKPRPVYRGVRAGYRSDSSEKLSSVRPIRIEDYVEIVQPR